MIIIDLLKNHPEAIQDLARIWMEVLGKIWMPDFPLSQVIQRFQDHLNDNSLPLTYIALYEGKPIGMCSLRNNDGFPSDFSPWLGSLVVDPAYQKRGVGKQLIDAAKKKASSLGFQKLYLFTFDLEVVDYYTRLGWGKIGIDEFKGHPVTVMEISI